MKKMSQSDTPPKKPPPVSTPTSGAALEHWKREFLSGLGHDLRTPLTSLQIYAALIYRRLRKGRPVEPRHVEQVLRLSKKLASILDDVID